MSWLKKLFGLCEHKWVIHGSCILTRGDKDVGALYVLRCEKCGDLRRRRIMGE